MKINKIKYKLFVLSIALILVFSAGVFSSSSSAADLEKISLEDALRLGYKNNSELKQSELSQEKSDLDLKLAWRSLFPQLNLESSYTRLGEAPEIPSPIYNMKYAPADFKDIDNIDPTKKPVEMDDSKVTLIPEMNAGPKDNYNTSISITQPIYMGGKIRLGIDQAKKGQDMAEIQAEKKKGEVLNQIIQSYYNLLMAKERVSIEEDALNLVREHKKMAKASFKSGMALKTDLLNAEIEVSKAQNSLNNARNQFKMAKKNFKNQIGLKGKNISIIGTELSPELDLRLEELYKKAVVKKPELKLIELNKEMTRTNLKLENRSKFPQIMLIGNYNWQGDELDFEDGSGNIVLSASMTLFDGGKSGIKEDKLEKEIKKIDESESSLKDMVKLDLEQQLVKLEEYKNNIKVQKMNLNKAKESLNIEKKRFEKGLGKSVDLLQVQTTLKQIKMGKMQAEYQYDMALFNILKKTGRLVDYCEEVINNEK